MRFVQHSFAIGAPTPRRVQNRAHVLPDRVVPAAIPANQPAKIAPGGFVA